MVVQTNTEVCQEFQNTPGLGHLLQSILIVTLEVIIQDELDIPIKQVSVKLLAIVLTIVLIGPIHSKKILMLLHSMTKALKKVQEFQEEVLP